MDRRFLKPWDWFEREEPQGRGVAARRGGDPLARMHREMDRMFEDFLGGSMRPRGETAADLLLRPSMDISETRDAYRVAVEVPGVERDGIELTVSGDDLVISGEKRQESKKDEEGFHRIERSYGRFRRVLTLPDDADPDNIRARFENGVLEIEIARREDGEKPGARKIEIGG